MKIVLRRSARDQILWDLHVILDQVAEGPTGQKQFAEQVLRKFGVSNLGRLRDAVCAKLPSNLEDADMAQILAVFESVLGIEWNQDMVPVSDEKRERFKQAVLAIVVEAKRAMPQEVVPRILDETSRIFGTDVSPELVPDLHRALERLLIERLLACGDDLASRQELADWVVDCVRRKARLDLS
jgi:hypothetical protein